MVLNSEFNLRNVQGWRTGLSNLLSAEFGRWGTKDWYIMMAIWVAIINGSLLGVLSGTDDVASALMILGLLAGMFPVINVVIVLQDVIIGEKETGTAAWILSKPVSRPAYILSKLIGNVVGIAVSLAIVPGIVVYGTIYALRGVLLPPGPFFAAIALLALNLIFFLTLTLMLGTLFDSRGGVIGIPMLLGPGYSLFYSLPLISEFHPMSMFFPSGNADVSFFGAVALGEPVGSLIPFFITILGSILFTAIALWRFNREEL
ncbi:MAG: ABC transporter permease subunit [Candidatus Heimdallarchaeota archaeon]|nr:MAG: ABC transporter permease subunit [Candidatus Heimdallarchaeota archaeon]